MSLYEQMGQQATKQFLLLSLLGGRDVLLLALFVMLVHGTFETSLEGFSISTCDCQGKWKGDAEQVQIIL